MILFIILISRWNKKHKIGYIYGSIKKPDSQLFKGKDNLENSL